MLNLIGILCPDDKGSADSRLDLCKHDAGEPGRHEQRHEHGDDEELSVGAARVERANLGKDGDADDEGRAEGYDGDGSRDDDAGEVVVDDHGEALGFEQIHGVLGSSDEVLAIERDLGVGIHVEVAHDSLEACENAHEDASSERLAIATALYHRLEGLEDGNEERAERNGAEGSGGGTLEGT